MASVKQGCDFPQFTALDNEAKGPLQCGDLKVVIVSPCDPRVVLNVDPQALPHHVTLRTDQDNVTVAAGILDLRD